MSSIFEGNGRDAAASGNGFVIKIEIGDKTRKLDQRQQRCRYGALRQASSCAGREGL